MNRSWLQGDRLPPQPWMTAPPTLAVLAALGAAGAELRFIGGSVRDALLGRPIEDIDIATPEPPQTVMDRLAAAGLRAIATGIAHGTVTAVADGSRFEITTLRRDVETFGRHARVAFTDDWQADASRRDFTFNALSCTPDGRLYDYFGGLDDLAQRRVRFVGDPRQRIAEDRLRLLRFFRFAAHYGRLPLDGDGLAAAAEAAPDLARLSGERIRAEMLKLLAAPDPAPVVAVMVEHGVLAHALPAGFAADRLAGMIEAERLAAVGADPLRRLAALIVEGATGAERVADRWRLANAERERLTALVLPEPVLAPDLEPSLRRRRLYELGADLWRNRVLVHWAAELALGKAGDAASWRELLELPRHWAPPVLPVQGRDLLALRLPAGPAVGRLLARLEQWWIGQDFAPGRKECLDWADSEIRHRKPEAGTRKSD